MGWMKDLREAKELLDEGLIDSDDYQEIKKESLERRHLQSSNWKDDLKEAKELFDNDLINENDYKTLRQEALSKRQKKSEPSVTLHSNKSSTGTVHTNVQTSQQSKALYSDGSIQLQKKDDVDTSPLDTRGEDLNLQMNKKDQVWLLWKNFDDTFYQGCKEFLLDITKGFDEEAGLDDWIRRTDPSRYEQAALEGLQMLGTVLSDRGGSLKAISGNRERLRQLSHQLIGNMRINSNRLSRASETVQSLNIPNSQIAGFFQGAAHSLNPTTSAGMGAAGGAAIGTILLPGIGTAIGGAIGGFLGGQQMENRIAEALQSHDDATEAMLKSLLSVMNKAWDILVEDIDFPNSNYFSKIEEDWEVLNENEAQSSNVESILHFIEHKGPYLPALVKYGYILLDQDIPDVNAARNVVNRALKIHEINSLLLEFLSDVLLAEGNYKKAIEKIHLGLEREPLHIGLRLSLIEALTLNNDISTAKNEATQLTTDSGLPDIPILFVAKGLIRKGNEQDAIIEVLEHMKTTGSPSRVLKTAATIPFIKDIVATGKLNPPDKITSPKSIAGRLPYEKDIMLRNLPSGDRKKNSTVWIGKLQKEETVLWFFDWSMFGNAKTGFLLTSKRVIWKCVFEAPEVFLLKDLSVDDIQGENEYLTIRDSNVDMERQGLGELLTEVIQELCSQQ